jgi:hypothetical protein
MSGIVESLHNAVNSGLHVKQDWVDMGFGIANTIAKIVDQKYLNLFNKLKFNFKTGYYFKVVPCFCLIKNIPYA